MNARALLGAGIAAAIAEEVARQLPNTCGSGDDWISQRTSPFGRTLHSKLCRLGALPGIRVHKRWLVRRRDLDAYILEHGIPAPTKPVPASNDNVEAKVFAKSRSGLRRLS